VAILVQRQERDARPWQRDAARLVSGERRTGQARPGFRFPAKIEDACASRQIIDAAVQLQVLARSKNRSLRAPLLEVVAVSLTISGDRRQIATRLLLSSLKQYRVGWK
jgi:hypothetical protein